jgi:lambda family phage portal protein
MSAVLFGDGESSARIRVREKVSAPKKAFYDGGQGRRRLAGWNPSAYTINSIMASQGETLRRRARDVVRNNPHAASAVESFVSNLIGSGIVPSFLIADAGLKSQVKDTWLAWTDECDADCLTDFYGQQTLIARALFDSGEAFIRFRPRYLTDGLTVPLQLQVMESDMLPYWDNRTAPNGNTIINGVEFDLRGRRAAYWFFRSHPGDLPVSSQASSGEQVRVPASEVLHIFKPLRSGQVRGVPMVAPALVKLWLLDQYDDAELDRKKVAAMYAGFITSPAPDDATDDDDDSPGDGTITLEPGTMQALLPGEDIKFSTPAEVGGSYEAFQYRNVLAAFAAMGVPYGFGTGDMRKANYSSMRGAIVEYRRRLQQLQHQVIAFQMCRPVVAYWMQTVALAGVVTLPGFARNPAPFLKVKWIPPKFEWVDPLKDLQAEKLAVDAGFKARSDVIEEGGEDPEETDRRIKADKVRESDLGLEFPVLKAASNQPASEADDLATQLDDAQAA